MNFSAQINFTDKRSTKLMDEFPREKVEKIKIFHTLEINCIHLNITSKIIKNLFESIHFSPITSFSFNIDSTSHLTYLSICTQDTSLLIDIDINGFESDNFYYLLEKMKNTLLISSANQQKLFSFFAKLDDFFFLKDSTVTFLKGCVSKLKKHIIKEYNLQDHSQVMTYKTFLFKSIKSILYYFLHRQSIPSKFFIDKNFFTLKLSKNFREFKNDEFILLEILHYDPSYFIQYAFHKETQSLAISYVFRVDPIENFWKRSFDYDYIYKRYGYVNPIQNEDSASNLEEEDITNNKEMIFGGLICPLINMTSVSQLNKSYLLDSTMKTKIIYTIFYALEFFYYNKMTCDMKCPDIYLTKIYIDSEFNVIISNTLDFFDTFQTGHIESPIYLPTEFIECFEAKSETTDIYSAGVCIYLLLSGDNSIEKMNFFQLNDLLHSKGFPFLSNEFGPFSFVQRLCVSDVETKRRKNSFFFIHLLNLFHSRIGGANDDEIDQYIVKLEKLRRFERNELYFKTIDEIKSKSSDESNPEYVFQMGMLLLFGEGVEKNIEKGLELIRHVADGGYEDAVYVLNYIKANSLFDVSKKQ